MLIKNKNPNICGTGSQRVKSTDTYILCTILNTASHVTRRSRKWRARPSIAFISFTNHLVTLKLQNMYITCSDLCSNKQYLSTVDVSDAASNSSLIIFRGIQHIVYPESIRMHPVSLTFCAVFSQRNVPRKHKTFA